MISEADTAAIRRLADRMAEARKADPASTIPVLLGSVHGKDIGLPTSADIGRAVFEQLSERGSADPVSLPVNWRESSDAEVGEAFTAWLRERSAVHRYKVLTPYYRGVPIPLFYRELADLVVASYVTCVLTTSVDSLFEQALDGAGLRRDIDYSVVVPGCSDPISKPAPGAEPPVTVVKLYGDLSRRSLPVGEDEIAEVLQTAKRSIRPQLSGNLIVVGHELTEPPQPIDQWLTADATGELWWVSPDPNPARLARLQASREVTVLSGEVSRPQEFVGWLCLQLLRLPALEASGLLPRSPDELSPDELEAEFYRGQLARSKAVSYALRQKRVPGHVEEPLEGRVLYQQLLDADLEARMRTVAAPPVSLRKVRAAADLLEELVAQAKNSPQASAVDYLQAQAQAVEREAHTASPDEGVVLGALQAARMVARVSLAGLVSKAVREQIIAAVRDFDERSS
ncbi:hypothetical protein [Streptomyces chartreusis]|uniref:hypothetical protein n=1 Tax=Streptomyces chartreusis TaxID=1969 RepID=UPI0037AE1962